VGGQLESMRAPILVLLFLSFSALAFSGNATADNTTPPSVPQGDGPVAVKAMLANGSTPVGMPVTIIATSGSSTATYRLITGREGNFLLQLGSGNYQLSATLDDMATSGVDYASSVSLSVPAERNLTMIFYPSGSVAASVLESGKLVPGADLHVSCSSDWFDYSVINGASARASDAGDFLFRALPTGTCVISASTQTAAGSAQVAIEHGKLANAQIEMKPKALALADIAMLGGAIVIVALLAYYLYSTGKATPVAAVRTEEKAPTAKKGRQKARAATRPAKANARPAAQHVEASAPLAHRASAFDAKSDKARAVLGTLSEREADIVRFLMSSGGKAKRSTMQHKLLIPKTSLLRNLRALERKNIVKLIPFGRNMVAELQRSLFE